MAVGMKIISPIMYSYALPSSFMDSQTFSRFKNGLHACPILEVQDIRNIDSVNHNSSVDKCMCPN